MITDIVYYEIQTVVSAALPTILTSLGGDEFVWIASSYALASTAFLPLCGNTRLTFATNGIELKMLEQGSGERGQGTAFDDITVCGVL
jgi:hypothetical protein